jgi:mRNA interferase RelE/StbE
VFKNFLLLERNPNAGAPLLGQLIGWHKLTVGDRRWRIVWRVTTDAVLGQVIEIAEVWAVDSRSESEVYAEVRDRIANLPDSARTTSLVDVVNLLEYASGSPSAFAIRGEWRRMRLIDCCLKRQWQIGKNT